MKRARTILTGAVLAVVVGLGVGAEPVRAETPEQKVERLEKEVATLRTTNRKLEAERTRLSMEKKKLETELNVLRSQRPRVIPPLIVPGIPSLPIPEGAVPRGERNTRHWVIPVEEGMDAATPGRIETGTVPLVPR